MRAALIALLVLAVVAAAPAEAQRSTPLSEVTVTGKRPTHVSEVEVEASRCTRLRAPVGPRPRVIASTPAQGAVVPPGPVTLSLAFDQPMGCGWAIAYDTHDELCTPVGVWDLPDRTRWRLRCTLSPGAPWSFRFDAVEGHGFASLKGAPAEPFTLNFSTAAEGAPGPEPPPGRRLLCPEHRRRGSGPQCTVAGPEVADPEPPLLAPSVSPR